MTAETILTDDTKEAVDDAIAAALGDAYDCNRVWSAWSYGTMGSDDFSLVAEDSGRLREITDAALQTVLQSEQVQAWKRDAERYRKLKSRQDADDEELEFAVIKNAHFDLFQTAQEFEEAIDAAMEKQI